MKYLRSQTQFFFYLLNYKDRKVFHRTSNIVWHKAKSMWNEDLKESKSSLDLVQDYKYETPSEYQIHYSVVIIYKVELSLAQGQKYGPTARIKLTNNSPLA